MDAEYPAYQVLVDTIMKHKGYDSTINWMTRRYIGHDHTEGDWAKRLDTPLFFLLKQTVNIPLPVGLTGFEAKWMNKDVVIRWTTSSETNTSYFELERSGDGRTYTSISRVAAAGNSTAVKNYNHVDADVNSRYAAPPAQLYYRLKIADSDGNVSYSAVVRLSNAATGKKQFTIYPNPVRNHLIVQGLEDDKTYTVHIYNTTGTRQSFVVKNKKALDLSGLPAGTYFLETEGQTLKFIKK